MYLTRLSMRELGYNKSGKEIVVVVNVVYSVVRSSAAYGAHVSAYKQFFMTGLDTKDDGFCRWYFTLSHR